MFDFLNNGFELVESDPEINSYELEDSFFFIGKEVTSYIHVIMGEIDNVELEVGEIDNEEDIINSNIANDFLIHLEAKTGLKLECTSDILITFPEDGTLEFSVEEI